MRIQRSALLWLVLIVVTPACSPADTLPASDWWTYRKDASGSARYAGNDVNPPLQLSWEHTFSEGTPRYLGYPVLGPDHVYVPLLVITGTAVTTELIALRLTDGNTEWSFSPAGARSNEMQGPPIISNDRIYAAFFSFFEGTSQGLEHIYALKPDGTVDWKIEASRGLPLIGRMTAANGLLLFCSLVNNERFLHAIHQDTGEEAWRVSLGQRPDSRWDDFITPVEFKHSTQGQLILIATRENMRALRFDPAREEVWRLAFPRVGNGDVPIEYKWSSHNDPSDVLVSMVPDDMSVVDVHRLSENGTLRRTVQFSATPLNDRSANHLASWGVGLAGQPDAILLEGTSVRSLSGWIASDPDGLRIYSPPAVAPGLLFYANSLRLHVLSTVDGSHLWSDNTELTPFNLAGGIAIDHGLVVASIGPRIRAFRGAP